MEMKDNIYPYPCTVCNCRNKDACNPGNCKRYLEWFKEEWEITTRPFRELARERDQRKIGTTTPREVTYREGDNERDERRENVLRKV